MGNQYTHWATQVLNMNEFAPVRKKLGHFATMRFQKQKWPKNELRNPAKNFRKNGHGQIWLGCYFSMPFNGSNGVRPIPIGPAIAEYLSDRTWPHLILTSWDINVWPCNFFEMEHRRTHSCPWVKFYEPTEWAYQVSEAYDVIKALCTARSLLGFALGQILRVSIGRPPGAVL